MKDSECAPNQAEDARQQQAQSALLVVPEIAGAADNVGKRCEKDNYWQHVHDSGHLKLHLILSPNGESQVPSGTRGNLDFLVRLDISMNRPDAKRWSTLAIRVW